MSRQEAIDPATAALLEAERDRQQRALTPAQRRKVQRDAGRNKATYDLPEGITKRISEIADHEGSPKSGVVAAFLYDAIRRYDDREIDLSQFKYPSDSPKYDYIIEIPDAPGRAGGTQP